MAEIRTEFYRKNVLKHFKDLNSSILVCGAGDFDKSVFQSCGFKNVTISNLDTRMNANQYSPYSWAFLDAQNLSIEENSYDYVAIHAAIHHAAQPHRVLTELYRVARKGFLAIESRDSLVMRFFERFGLTQVYEHAAVYYNDGKFGGVNNTQIPNFVYRWTEREIEKTINCYAPYAKHKFSYSYETSFPVSAQLEKGKLMIFLLLKLVQPFFLLATRLFKKQQNLFAFYIEKPKLPKDLFEWIKRKDNELVFDMNWADAKFKSKRPNVKD